MSRCARSDCRRTSSWFHRRAGLSVNGKWYCSAACVASLARRQLLGARRASGGLPPAVHLRLGVWLRRFGVSQDQLTAGLAGQQVTRLRLGAQLVALGHATKDMVLQALARQASTDFIADLDPAVVRLAPAGLSAHAVRALSLVPFTPPERGHVRVACAGPLPRVGLAAFSRLTGLVPEPYLVTDETFEALAANYGRDAECRETAEFVEASSLGDAVDQITQAPALDGIARLVEIHIAPLRWVRVQSEAGTRDVVLHESQHEIRKEA